MHKYVMSIAGPDDVIDYADELAALRAANEVNRQYLQQRLRHGTDTPLAVATVAQKQGDVFMGGFEAYTREEPADTNPYATTQPTHEEWHAGWLKSKACRNKKITASARDEPCTMQLPEICTGGGADTVFAHSNYQEDGKGMGRKSDDLFGAYMCRACHDEYDNRTVQRPDWMDLDEMRDRFHRAMKRTWSRLVEKGVLT